jgi:succinate dehydrogenase (ubiquinone) membrane anchor subunit
MFILSSLYMMLNYNRSVIIDYIPIKRMPKIRKLFWWALRAGTVLVGVGLYQFETNDIGLTETIKKIWKA